jgi:hypothetical protein
VPGMKLDQVADPLAAGCDPAPALQGENTFDFKSDFYGYSPAPIRGKTLSILK